MAHKYPTRAKTFNADKVEDAGLLYTKKLPDVSHSNFTFLKIYDPLFFQLASLEKDILIRDANTRLLKLRQFSETLVKDITVQISTSSTINLFIR